MYTHLKEKFKTELTSERLLLKPLSGDDARFILQLLNTEGWLQYIGDRQVKCISDAENYIQKIASNHDVVYWVVFEKQVNMPIGVVTLIQRKELRQPDIGFAFLPSFGKSGYAYESCCAVLRHIFHKNEFSSLNAITVEQNASSIRLLKKMGFAFVEEKIIGDSLIHLYNAEADKILISYIIFSFFSVFTNSGGKKPQIHMLADICIPEVLLVNKTPLIADVMGLTSFLTPREKILTNGTLTEFEEKETFEETKISGGIAQRYSEYEKKGFLEGTAFYIKGHKFFQFVKVDGSWKISYVSWRDLTSDQ